MQLQLDARYQAVADFITEAAKSGVPPVAQADLYRFGTVLVCGYIERAMEIITVDRLSTRAQPRVLNFIRSHFKRGRNFDCTAAAELLSRFDSDWYRKFDAFVQANGSVKEGVSSCYGLRNTIAHGGTATVSLKRLNELLDSAKAMIDAVVDATR